MRHYFIKIQICRWNHKKGRYVKLAFVEKMIEHLSIDSFILEVKSALVVSSSDF